jgi:type IV secretion system protein VirB6/type IV secretion system protein TrbL
VLALLALACFPVLAQAADESSGVQYETAVPTATGHTTPPKGADGSPANSSSSGGAPAPTGSGSSNTSGSGSSSGGSSSASTNPSTGSGTGADQAGQGNGSTAANGHGAKQGAGGLSNGQLVSPQAVKDDSSPLTPILIAIAALAAISIAAVVIRQRRQRQSPGARVSPKAS